MKKLVLSLAFYCSMMSTLYSAVVLQSPITITSGTTTTIDKHGVCKRVTNNTGQTIFVPTNSSDEWEMFLNNSAGTVAANCVTIQCYIDSDGDGFGTGSATSYPSCPVGTVSNNGDCDDTIPSVNLSCMKQNCYADNDGDGYGAGVPVSEYTCSSGKVTNNDDCNDSDPGQNLSCSACPTGQHEIQRCENWAHHYFKDYKGTTKWTDDTCTAIEGTSSYNKYRPCNIRFNPDGYYDSAYNCTNIITECVSTSIPQSRYWTNWEYQWPLRSRCQQNGNCSTMGCPASGCTVTKTKTENLYQANQPWDKCSDGMTTNEMCCPDQTYQCCGSAGADCYSPTGTTIYGTSKPDGLYRFSKSACSYNNGFPGYVEYSCLQMATGP